MRADHYESNYIRTYCQRYCRLGRLTGIAEIVAGGVAREVVENADRFVDAEEQFVVIGKIVLQVTAGHLDGMAWDLLQEVSLVRIVHHGQIAIRVVEPITDGCVVRRKNVLTNAEIVPDELHTVCYARGKSWKTNN